MNKRWIVKFSSLVLGGLIAFGCTCPTPQVPEKAAVPEYCTKEECIRMQNELNALKLKVDSLKRELDGVKVSVDEANLASKKALEAANKAEEAAKRAETAAQKAERIFEKGLKK